MTLTRRFAPASPRGRGGLPYIAVIFLLSICLGSFAQSSAPSVTVNGAPVLLSLPVTRVGGEWFVPLRSISKALQIEVTLTAGSPLLYARRAAGDEITYDFRTGEIRDRYVLIGTVKQYQNVKQAPSADTLLFPVSGVVALLGVDVAEDAQGNILEFSSSPFASRNSSTGPSLNLSKMDYRYGMTTNGQKVAQFLDLNGEALIGSVRTKGKALLSGYPGQPGIGMSQASLRAEWMDGKAATLGTQNIYTGIDALNAGVLAGTFERGFGGFRALAYAGRAVGLTTATVGLSRPQYDTTIAGVSMRRKIQGGELAFGANLFRGATRNGDTVGFSYTATGSSVNQFKVQTLFGNFNGLSSRTVSIASTPVPTFFQQQDPTLTVVEERRNQQVSGMGTGVSLTDTFTPVRQLTISGQYDWYGKNFLTANDDTRFNGQTARSVLATVRPFSFLSFNGGIGQRRSFIGENGLVRTYTYGATLATPGGAQFGFLRSIQKDPTSPLSQFVMTQYSVGLPSAGRYLANVMLSEMNFQGKKVRNVNSIFGINETRFGQIAVHDQIQFGSYHRVGLEMDRHLENGGTLRIGVDRVFTGTGSAFAPTATIQLPLPRGRSLQVSYISDGKSHLIQLEFGGHLRQNRSLEMDSAGNPRIVAEAPLVGRIYLDMDSNGKFDPGVDRPMPGVVVWLDRSKSATSDAQGNYRFDEVEPGAHQLQPDIAAVAADLTFAGAAEKTVNVAPYRNNKQDLRLVKTSRIAGKVTYVDYSDIDNPVERPLPDARIVATDRFDTFSEVDGQFLLGDLPPGEYSFHLDPATIPANYQPKQSIVSVNLKSGESLTGIRFELVVPPKPVIMLN